ncbi:Cyclin-D4-1 [Glycine soja]
MEGSIDPATSSLLCLENNDMCFDDFDCNVADESPSLDHKNLNFNNQYLIKDNHHGSEHLLDFSVQSDETVLGLVGREKENLPQDGYLKRLLSGDLDLSVRKEALDWIWKAHAYFDFGPCSLCLSVNYLDRFLSVYELPRGKSWSMQLLAVACLSIAAKMEEIKVPPCVDLQERILKCLELIKDLSLIQDSANLGTNLASFVPQSPIGVLDAACLSSISDELTVGSYTDSSLNTPNSKRRRKSD